MNILKILILTALSPNTPTWASTPERAPAEVKISSNKINGSITRVEIKKLLETIKVPVIEELIQDPNEQPGTEVNNGPRSDW